MTRPADSDPEDLRSIERRLESELLGIQRDLQTLLSADDESIDELVDSDFGRSVARIEKTIGGLRRALDRLAVVGPVDLSAVAEKALSELLEVTEKPLVLTVAWEPNLPLVVLPVEAAQSVVARTMSLLLRYLQPGDAVALRTFVDGDAVGLRAEVSFDNLYVTPAWVDELQLRSSSLGEFVSDLGGSFELCADETLCFELRLRSGARVR